VKLQVLALSAGAAALITLAGCGTSNTPATSSGGGSGTCPGTAAVSGLGTVAATIDATDALIFVPGSTTAHTGDVIEFKNTGSVAHTVTFQGGNDGCLTDETLAPGSTWEVKFTVAGTYNYLCTVHAPNMKGEITVS
jgi:plastocyanin